MADNQLNLVRAIEHRMVEIGKPKGHAFGQSELTWLFADCGWVMISVDGKKDSFLFPKERLFREAIKELGL